MDHFFTRNSMGRVFGFLEVNSVRKKWKIYLNFKIPEIFGFLDLGLSLEPDTWLYLSGHGISQTQPMWGHTQNFNSFEPLILHLPGGSWISPPLTQMWSWDPLTIRVKIVSIYHLDQNTSLNQGVLIFNFPRCIHRCTNKQCIYHITTGMYRYEVTSDDHKNAQTTTDNARTPPTRPISLGTLPESPSTPSSSHLSAQQRLWLTHWSPAPQAEHGAPWG